MYYSRAVEFSHLMNSYTMSDTSRLAFHPDTPISHYQNPYPAWNFLNVRWILDVAFLSTIDRTCVMRSPFTPGTREDSVISASGAPVGPLGVVRTQSLQLFFVLWGLARI